MTVNDDLDTTEAEKRDILALTQRINEIHARLSIVIQVRNVDVE